MKEFLVVAAALLQIAKVSASPLSRRDDGNYLCASTGYSAGTDSYTLSTDDGGYPACSTLCFSQPACKSFAWSTTECQLYSVSATNNFNYGLGSEWNFYDRECETAYQQCGTKGFQAQFDSFWWSDTIDFLTCASLCQGNPSCRSYAYGNGECSLYAEPVYGTINVNDKGNAGSPYSFYDVACSVPCSSPTSVSTTVSKSAKSSTSTASSTIKTTGTTTKSTITTKTSSVTKTSSSTTVAMTTKTTTSVKLTTKSSTTTTASLSTSKATTTPSLSPSSKATTTTIKTPSTTATTGTTTAKPSSTATNSPTTTKTNPTTSKPTTTTTKGTTTTKKSTSMPPSTSPTALCGLPGYEATLDILTTTNGDSYNDCLADCTANPTCKSFAFATSNNQCNLFDVSASAASRYDMLSPYHFYDVDCTTAYKICGVAGWDFQFQAYWDGVGYTADSCAAACVKDAAACRSFAFGGDGGECHLYFVPVTGNINAQPASPYSFSDATCVTG